MNKKILFSYLLSGSGQAPITDSMLWNDDSQMLWNDDSAMLWFE